jgi:hypothetical protein
MERRFSSALAAGQPEQPVPSAVIEIAEGSILGRIELRLTLSAVAIRRTFILLLAMRRIAVGIRRKLAASIKLIDLIDVGILLRHATDRPGGRTMADITGSTLASGMAIAAYLRLARSVPAALCAVCGDVANDVVLRSEQIK